MKAEDQLPGTKKYVYSQRPREEGKLENLFEICHYFKNGTIVSETEKGDLFSKINPISGGPMIAYFYEEYLAMEYCNWKNQ